MPSPEDEVIIAPLKTAGDPNLPATGLFFVNPFEADYAVKRARKSGFRSCPLFNSNLFLNFSQEKPYFICGPAVGAPMAALTLEKIIACGARNIILVGWCGALQRSLKVGDLVLPTRGRSTEGTSAHYPLNREATGDQTLGRQLDSFLESRLTVPTSGPLWTTDAPYRETRAQIGKYQAEGVLAVDMEFTALATVAAFRGVRLAAVMLVSDLLFGREWQAGFRSKPFKRTSRLLVEHLFEFASAVKI